MRVKRLEIQGFKSFKDKTTIHFDHGITGIVGPNGCGKSNIVDAFFWVMGEQSYKHMRGSGSDDLIFNGSSKYSPLGLAEATMVLEQDIVDTESAPSGASATDAPLKMKKKEIAVTRRLYRGGEGEYFINGVQARLKDIHELFMDTGVGAKGYSVIEQGQIGKIVNSKPEDRRLLIEEAAGIAKYKARKKESLRKMEAAQGNLSRLNDIIQEIERNLASLERQAQKARQYKKYKEELFDKEMTWGRRKTQVLRERLDGLKSQREALEQELVGLKAELTTAENTVEVERVDQVVDTKQAEELHAKIQDLSDDLTRERSALELSRQRQSDLTNQLQSLEGEKNDLEASVLGQREQLALQEEELRQADEVFRSAAQKAQTMDEQVRSERQQTESERRQLDSHKRELMEGISASSSLLSRAAALDQRLESARAQSERLAQQVQEQVERVEAAREESEKASVAVENIKFRREELQDEKRKQSSTIQTQEQSVREADRERDQHAREVTKVRSRLQSLQELVAAYEGFGDGPKAILDWAKSTGKGGALRALAEVLDVQTGYEAALEGWLENRLESLISEDASIALEALANLRDGKKGRAAIHVASAVEKQSESIGAVRAMLEGAGFKVRGELSQYISINDKAGKNGTDAARNAIANVCVVDSFEPMAAFIQSGKATSLKGWSIVSLDGAALDHEGALRGGITQSGDSGAASILGRKRAIADLESQIAVMDERQTQLENLATQARQALDLARARFQTLQNDVQALEVQAAALERDVHQMNRSLKDAENQLSSLKNEQERTDREAARAQEERQAVDAELVEITTRRTELETMIASSDEELVAKDAHVRGQEQELQALRINEAQLRERASSLKRECETGRSFIAERERRLSAVKRALEVANQEHSQFTGGDVGMEERIEELTLLITHARDQLSVVKDRMEQASSKVNSALERIKSLHKTGDAKTGESTSLALEAEKLSGELAHLVQNLEEKYGPGCLEKPVTSPIQEEMSGNVVTTEMSAEEEQALSEEVERLRERIRRLGEVNVMAIEEFEETKKRFDYLLGEKTDLETSIKNLEDAIEHINKTSEERFAKAFQSIADRFEKLFPIIFGGGQAKLSLVYPEGSTDILDAGVDILAQPPGKKVTNIGLLSGGEKALTAVSLIFAIFMVKPSPFCVLDEVDAPLDDANIGKFNALLREMSVKSQFILITHNKKTMELNDTLYGVTMEEPGVSKMVSIQLQ